MKSQPVTRLGQMMYPEKLHMREQTLVNIIRLCVLSFCLAFWYGVYRILKVLF
jgi:hypothetical protein